MTAIPVWLTGPGGAYTVSITPQTVAAAGTLTPGTTSTITADIDEVTIDNTPVTEEISNMTSGYANEVILQENTKITLVEILKSNGVNKLAAAAVAGNYFVIVVTRGGQTWTFTGSRGPYQESLRRGKSTGSLTVNMASISATNPAYA